MTTKKWVYSFGDGVSEGSSNMKDLLGGKGANLAEMCNLGLAVPPGFTISTEVCTHYYSNNKAIPESLERQVDDAITKVEAKLGLKFGSDEKPLLVSIRSGARASMPGMMDTILNLGLNDVTVEALAKMTANPRFAYDSYRRFIQMYSDVVLGIDHSFFEELLDMKKIDNKIKFDNELTPALLLELVSEFKELVKRETGHEFEQNVTKQLWGAIKAVLNSWMNNRAITYRKLNDIPESWGTAVNVQSMVFGNLGETSATGVAFTRDPSSGEKFFYGEYLVNAQGEDVVAGIRTPAPINKETAARTDSNLTSMASYMPEVYNELCGVYKKLEAHYRDMQDIEFTVQDKKLWILQTRSGKRTAEASVKIAVDMYDEGLITKEEAVMRVNPNSLDQLLHPKLDPKAKCEILDRGLPASPGAASGIVVFSAEDAEVKAAMQKKVILVRIETSPEDIGGMNVAQGILTARGGMTSHAAVVARGMGKPCVSGASGIVIDYKNKILSAKGKIIKEGDVITINGSNGDVIIGEVPTIQANLSDDFMRLMSFADEIRSLKVRANAETEADATVARKFNCEGIGLCRTEHMFFEDDRIIAVREMIVATSEEKRKAALAKILPMQRKDFMKIFKIMDSLPVNIRFLDPPLHEFLPHTEDDIRKVAEEADVTVDHVRIRALQLKESNPMLGHRGCRLGITYPEIYEMQARAVFEAMAETIKSGIHPIVEIMIPLVLDIKELELMAKLVRDTAKQVEEENNIKLDFQIGTMIELPRAALKADEIAREAEYFSFGTNDLTQTTMGISRDDAAGFIDEYQNKLIMENDPFVKLDQEGVGQLVEIAVERGRKTRPNIKLGICGEHGGEPSSIHFFHKIGLEYVSCSPYRVPIARLAAAQAKILHG